MRVHLGETVTSPVPVLMRVIGQPSSVCSINCIRMRFSTSETERLGVGGLGIANCCSILGRFKVGDNLVATSLLR